jgi:hypothetical protein
MPRRTGENMNNFVERLREINKRVEAERAAEASDDKEVQWAQQILDNNWVINKLSKLKGKAQRAARKGKKKVRVGKIEIYDGYGGRFLNAGKLRPDKLSCEQLRGKWQMLYKACERIGFKVNVFWTHDSMGVSDWYEFWVEW